jgi:pantoate--beta-alanine ligase
VGSKLFSLAGRSTAVFGRKDYQQWKLIERMALDLFFPVRVVSAPIVREADGLAMSSRNERLGRGDRSSALGLVHGLASAERAFVEGERDARSVLSRFRDVAVAAGVRIDYASVVDARTLEPLETQLPGEALLAVAGFVGDVRLIDNVLLQGPDTTLGAFVSGGQ